MYEFQMNYEGRSFRVVNSELITRELSLPVEHWENALGRQTAFLLDRVWSDDLSGLLDANAERTRLSELIVLNAHGEQSKGWRLDDGTLVQLWVLDQHANAIFFGVCNPSGKHIYSDTTLLIYPDDSVNVSSGMARPGGLTNSTIQVYVPTLEVVGDYELEWAARQLRKG